MLVNHTFISKPVKGMVKQWGLWVMEGNQIAPLVYFQKPKWIKESQWAEIVNAIEINLPKNYRVGE